MKKTAIDFMVIGTQKAGTTALDYYLRQHPAFSMPTIKETHFFDNEKEFIGTPNYSNYHKYFTDWSKKKLHGEVTPIYMYWKNSIKRIHEYNKDIKLIIILRDPIRRAFSHWNMETNRGRENLSFHDAIMSESIRLKKNNPPQHRTYSYIDRGCYSQQLENILQYFQVEQIILLEHEELRNAPLKALNIISCFLETIEFPKFIDVNINLHSGVYEDLIPYETYKILKAKYESEVIYLEKKFNFDCSGWLME